MARRLVRVVTRFPGDGRIAWDLSAPWVSTATPPSPAPERAIVGLPRERFDVV